MSDHETETPTGARKPVSTWNLANVLTMGRIALVPFFAWFLLADGGDGICTCDLATAVGLTEATTSHHLGQLRKAGMVSPERRGMNVYYRPRPESLEALRQVLNATTGCC